MYISPTLSSFSKSSVEFAIKSLTNMFCYKSMLWGKELKMYRK